MNRDAPVTVHRSPVHRPPVPPIHRRHRSTSPTDPPVPPMDRWPVDRWIGGTGGRWTSGSVAYVEGGPMDRWHRRKVHRWIGGVGGSVALVDGGPVDHRHRCIPRDERREWHLLTESIKKNEYLRIFLDLIRINSEIMISKSDVTLELVPEKVQLL